jgi:hypothetical protein
MALIGKPTVTEYHAGIPVTLDQLEAIFYTLAPAYGEEDYDAIAKLVARAQRDLTEGRATMPALASAFLSHALTGTYSAGRDVLDEEFRASGKVLRTFEHNVFGSRYDCVFYDLAIRASEIGPDLYLLTILENNSSQRRRHGATLEILAAKALGIERALTSIQVSFPIEVVKNTQFRFDFAPFMDVVRRLGIGPIQYANTTAMTGDAAADYLMAFVNHTTDAYRPSPTFHFDCPKHPGLAMNMAVYGCNFAVYDSWDKARTVNCRRDGTVITGPLHSEYGNDTKLEKPRLVFMIQRPHKRDGDPIWPVMATTELMAPMRKLVTDLTTEIER